MMSKKSSAAVTVILTLLVAALCVTTVMMISASTRHQKAHSTQQAQIASLQQRVAQQQAADDREALKVRSLATGTDQTRVATDTKAIQDLVTTATTWNSGASYDAVRGRIQSVYQLSPTGSFMTALLPPQPHRVDNTGKSYYYLDSIDAKSAPDQVAVLLSRVAGVNYVYTVEATLSTGGSSTAGATTSNTAILVTVTVDPGGHFLDVQAVAAGAPSRLSGGAT